MASFEQTIIIGNVGKDPEMRYLQNGSAVCSFSVAVSKKWTDKNTNEKHEKTKWYKVSCWRQLAETANNYVKKGMQIQVVGEIDARAYIDNAGEAAFSLELTANNLVFLGQRGDGESRGGRDADQGHDSRGSSDTDSIRVDDIPF